MKPDNIMGNLANPQSWNLYSYVHGNPVNYNDPTGHSRGGASHMWYGNSMTASMWNGIGVEDYLSAFSGGGGAGATRSNLVYGALNSLGLGDLTAAVLAGEVTVHIEAVMDDSLTWEQQNAYQKRFDVQVADARQVFGWLGIGFSVNYLIGDVNPANAIAEHTVRVVLSTDFAALRGKEGTCVVDGNKALIMIAESRAGSGILSHELGHAFGIRGFWDDSAKIQNAIADIYINNLTRNLRYTGVFGLVPFAPGWSLGPWVVKNALDY